MDWGSVINRCRESHLTPKPTLEILYLDREAGVSENSGPAVLVESSL